MVAPRTVTSVTRDNITGRRNLKWGLQKMHEQSIINSCGGCKNMTIAKASVPTESHNQGATTTSILQVQDIIGQALDSRSAVYTPTSPRHTTGRRPYAPSRNQEPSKHDRQLHQRRVFAAESTASPVTFNNCERNTRKIIFSKTESIAPPPIASQFTKNRDITRHFKR